MLGVADSARYVWEYGYLSVQGRVGLAERADEYRQR
jgi:hypothetical protein